MRSLLVVCLLAAAPASAGDGPPLDATHVSPSFDATRTLWTDDAGLAEDRTVSMGIGAGYAYGPVAIGPGHPHLADVLSLEARGGFTRGRIRLATAMPAYPLVTGAKTGAGVGDMVFDGKLVLVESGAPVGLALGARATLPTATVEVPVGSSAPTWALQGIADRHLGPVLVAVNAGYRGVPPSALPGARWDDHVFVRVGAGAPVSDRAGVSLDVGGRALWGAPLVARTTPAEAVAGGWWRLGDEVTLRGGLGVGLTRGISASRARGLVQLTWTPPREEPRPPRKPLVYVPPPDEPDPVPEPAPEASPAPPPAPPPAPRVQFAFDDAALGPDAAPRLDALAAWLADHPSATVRVEGHADPRGCDAYNDALALRRAEAVAAALVARGVPRERLRVAGFGERRPLADAPASRRVEIVVAEAVAAP